MDHSWGPICDTFANNDNALANVLYIGLQKWAICEIFVKFMLQLTNVSIMAHYWGPIYDTFANNDPNYDQLRQKRVTTSTFYYGEVQVARPGRVKCDFQLTNF